MWLFLLYFFVPSFLFTTFVSTEWHGRFYLEAELYLSCLKKELFCFYEISEVAQGLSEIALKKKKKECRDTVFWLMNFRGFGPLDHLQAWIVWLNEGCHIHPRGHGQVIPLE